MKQIRDIVKFSTAILLLGLFCSNHLSAQEQQTSMETKLQPKLGIKGGVNFTNLYVDDVSDEHMKVGFNAGLYAKLPLARGLSIQPELLYTVKGAKETYSNFIQGDGEYHFNLNYIELPLTVVINVAKNFNLHAGGYAAYLVSANIKDVNDDGTINGATDLNEDNFHRWDAGLVGGLGFDIENVSIGARYNYGLMEIGKSGNLSGDLTNNSKNAGFSIFVGLAF
jgi:hypothetical protein